jgi:hypothetical protein
MLGFPTGDLHCFILYYVGLFTQRYILLANLDPATFLDVFIGAPRGVYIGFANINRLLLTRNPKKKLDIHANLSGGQFIKLL